MNRKDLIRLINEEVSGYDFLNLDEIENEESLESLLSSKEFQTKFVHDVLNNFGGQASNQLFKNKEVVAHSSNIEDLEPNSFQKFRVQYVIDFTYNYNGKEMPLSLIIEGDDIAYDLDVVRTPSDYVTPPETDTNFDINWDDFSVKIMYDGAIEVELDWLYKNKNIYKKFIQSFVNDLISY